MRVLIATPLYPPESGGPATYSKILEEELARAGDSVTLLKFSDFEKYPKYLRNVAYFFAVLDKAYSSDLVLVLDPVSTGFPAVVAARLVMKKVVVKIVGDYAWEQGVQKAGVTDTLDQFIRNKNVPRLCGFFRMVQKLSANLATKIVVPSEYLKGVVMVWGIPEKKIEVIYNAIELPTDFPVVQAPTRYLITLARLVPWKGIDALIEVYGRVRKEFPTLSLVVVGDGPERERLENKAVEASGEILFTGKLENSEALAYVQKAEAFVLNSSYEGLSHVLIEAAMLGVPIIATKAGGNAEVVQEGKNGLMVPVGSPLALQEGLEKVLRHDTELSSERAREAQERFSVARMIEKTRELFRSLI